MEVNTLTLTLQNFIAAFSSGYSRLQGPASTLLGILVVIEVALLGLWTALGGGENIVGVFKQILKIGAWVWIVRSYPSLAKAFRDSLIQAGTIAGGGKDASLLLNPSHIASYGFQVTATLHTKLNHVSWTEPATLLTYWVGYVCILFCFLLLAIHVFSAVLEYYLFLSLVGIFLPFGVFPPTQFLAEKAISAIVATSVKLMVLAFVLSVVDPVLAGMHFSGPDPTFNELWSVLLTVGAITLLCWKAPGLAAGLLAGSPHLGAAEAAVGTAALAGFAAAKTGFSLASKALSGKKKTGGKGGRQDGGETGGGSSGGGGLGNSKGSPEGSSADRSASSALVQSSSPTGDSSSTQAA